jgi:hypothetical protein
MAADASQANCDVGSQQQLAKQSPLESNHELEDTGEYLVWQTMNWG